MSGQFQLGLPIFWMDGNANREIGCDNDKYEKCLWNWDKGVMMNERIQNIMTNIDNKVFKKIAKNY